MHWNLNMCITFSNKWSIIGNLVSLPSLSKRDLFMQQKRTQIQEMWISLAHLLFVQKAASSLGSCWLSSHEMCIVVLLATFLVGRRYCIERVHEAVRNFKTRINWVWIGNCWLWIALFFLKKKPCWATLFWRPLQLLKNHSWVWRSNIERSPFTAVLFD